MRHASLPAALVLALALSPAAQATVERLVVYDAEGESLVAVTFDGEKAIRAGEARGFLVLVERLNASRNLTVFFEVARFDASAFEVVSLPMLEPLGDEPVGLKFRLRANASAAHHEYPVGLALTVVNLNASSNATVLTRAEFAMNVTVSPLPTPLGESPATLSEGEWVAVGAVAAVIGGSALALVGRRRARRREQG